MSSKTHWKKLHNPDYLGAYALEPGQDLIVTIAAVRNEMVTGTDGKKEELPVGRFKESGVKPMILNSTNCKTITTLVGSPYIEDWSGHAIQIYSTTVNAFGSETEALRIRPFKPRSNGKPALTPDSEKWASAIESLRGGKTTIDSIRKHYLLTDEHADILIEQAANNA